MVPAKYNFPSHYAGDTVNAVSFDFNIDLTGATAAFEVKNGNSVAYTATNGNGLSVSATTISLDAFSIEEAGQYKYTMTVTHPDGEERTYFGGSIVMRGGV